MGLKSSPIFSGIKLVARNPERSMTEEALFYAARHGWITAEEKTNYTFLMGRRLPWVRRARAKINAKVLEAAGLT